MDKASLLMLMVIFMRVIMSMEKLRVKEYSSPQVVKNMRETGQTVYTMALEKNTGMMDPNTKVTST